MTVQQGTLDWKIQYQREGPRGEEGRGRDRSPVNQNTQAGPHQVERQNTEAPRLIREHKRLLEVNKDSGFYKVGFLKFLKFLSFQSAFFFSHDNAKKGIQVQWISTMKMTHER